MDPFHSHADFIYYYEVLLKLMLEVLTIQGIEIHQIHDSITLSSADQPLVLNYFDQIEDQLEALR